MLRCIHLRMITHNFNCFSSQVILCTKANNVKAKASAFNLLEEIGNCVIYNDSRSKEGKFYQMLLLPRNEAELCRASGVDDIRSDHHNISVYFLVFSRLNPF